MASCYIAVSKSRLRKDLIFDKLPRISKPIYHFCSSVDKPPNEENPDSKLHLSIQAGMIEDEKSRTPAKIEDTICRMMEDDAWSTRLSEISVPLFDHSLVYSVLNRMPSRALEFFQWVEGSGFKHDRQTHYKMIDILCRDRRLEDAKRILLGMSKKGIHYDEDLFVLLIHGYAKCNRKWDIVKNCVKVFLKMEELGVSRTINSYNPLLEVLTNEKRYTMADKFFDKMLSEGVIPTQHTYTLMISGLCRSSRVNTANRFFQDMKTRNLLPDFGLYNTMINGYVKVKKMEEAEKLLMEMKQLKIDPLLVTYSSLINGYTQVRRMEDAEKLVVEMKTRNVEPNLITYNTMINGYALVEKMEDAHKLFMEMKNRRDMEPDLVSYATMIKGYVAVNRVEDGLKLVEEMKRKRFRSKVDFKSCLGGLKEECDGEKMSESQRNVLQAVEDHVERLELLVMQDAVRELSQLATQRVVDGQGKMKMNEEAAIHGGGGGDRSNIWR